ncbi:S41 family peptidase [Streptomyces albireticuli]
MALALAGGTVLTATGATAAPAGTPRPATDGVWRMDGYGTVLVLSDGHLQEYQTTAVSCMKSDSAERTGTGAGPVASYTTGGGVVLTVRARPGGDRASLHADGAVGDRGLRRVAALPESCGHPVDEKDSLASFDVFWQSFEENYPFFAAKGIDWHKVRDQYRPKVRVDTPKEELFALFGKMVAPLNDAHVAVQDGGKVFARTRPGTEMPGPDLDKRAKAHILERDLKGRKTHEFANGRITYADLPDGQGYLRISGFGGYAAEGAPYATQLAELDRALDAVFTRERVRSLRGLIIDLRVNGGGSDAMGLRIAGRLTDTPYLAYSKRARNDPADATRHTRPQPLYVTPAKAPRYTGPVAVLIGGSTVSAGETFTQALMDRPGGTVRIGQHTQGVFSDVMTRVLPDGMAAWLPNEEFLNRSGRSYDGPGIPPSARMEVPVFTEEEFRAGRDSAFDKAVEVLRSRKA